MLPSSPSWSALPCNYEPQLAVPRACRQTGYLGRSGVYELMQLNAAMQSAVAHNPDLTNLRHLAIEGGMRPLPSIF